MTPTTPRSLRGHRSTHCCRTFTESGRSSSSFFLSGDFKRKEWCGIEFRAIKEIIMKRDNDKIMFVRMDDVKVDGVFNTDGFVDGGKFGPEDIARFIQERVELLK